jgi:hypothetical protein
METTGLQVLPLSFPIAGQETRLAGLPCSQAPARAA